MKGTPNWFDLFIIGAFFLPGVPIRLLLYAGDALTPAYKLLKLNKAINMARHNLIIEINAVKFFFDEGKDVSIIAWKSKKF